MASHTLRRTVATLLDEAGRTIVQTADQLGHSDPTTTLRRYIKRLGDTAGNAEVL